MKNLGFLALGLLCGIVLPFSTYATIEDGIYTVEGGHKTAVFSGTMITVASGDLEGYYFWGWNEPSYDNNGNLIPGKEWETNPTNGVEHNDDWGGGDDNENNGDNSGPNPNRQGPCKSGWHVPSLGEIYEIYEIGGKDRELLNFNTYDIWYIQCMFRVTSL